MRYVREVLIFLILSFTTYAFIPDDPTDNLLNFMEITDGFLKQHEAGVQRFFGKAHLSRNKNSSPVSQATPIVWGEAERILVMLEVKHFSKNCTRTRNVVFLLSTNAPSTIISPLVKRLIFQDCGMRYEETYEKVIVSINGRKQITRLARDEYANTNIIGMDFLRDNNVEFSMKLHHYYRAMNVLTFKFDSFPEEDL